MQAPFFTTPCDPTITVYINGNFSQKIFPRRFSSILNYQPHPIMIKLLFSIETWNTNHAKFPKNHHFEIHKTLLNINWKTKFHLVQSAKKLEAKVYARLRLFRSAPESARLHGTTKIAQYRSTTGLLSHPFTAYIAWLLPELSVKIPKARNHITQTRRKIQPRPRNPRTSSKSEKAKRKQSAATLARAACHSNNGMPLSCEIPNNPHFPLRGKSSLCEATGMHVRGESLVKSWRGSEPRNFSLYRGKLEVACARAVVVVVVAV